MNKSYLQLLSFIFLLLLSSNGCKSAGEEPSVQPETEKVGKVTSIKSFPGKNRIKLQWELPSGNQAVKTRVFWDDEKQSREINTPLDTASLIIDNLEEGNYIFSIYNYDAKEKRSDKVSVISQVYGDKYAASLGNRKIKDAGLREGSAIINWQPVVEQGMISTELKYNDAIAGLRTILIPKTTSNTVLENYVMGGEFEYRTKYLPQTEALDTFYTDYETVTVSDRILVAPTDIGWTELSWNQNSYKIQNRTEVPESERFWIKDGIFTCKVMPGEERVEMRWDSWPDQRREYMWDGDIMFEPGSNKTCIMQIKSNEDGEPIYIQIFNENGDIRNNGDKSPIATGMYNKWFNLKASFDPVTGIGRAWIDNVLVKVREYRTPTSGWYFKNGCYNNAMEAGMKSVAHFKNIRFWIKD